MSVESLLPPSLLESLQSPSGPPWITSWADLVKLDAAACLAIEPFCSRFSDKDREVPRECRQSLLKGDPAPPALRLCRSLDWTNFFQERPLSNENDEDDEILFPRLMTLPIWDQITHLSLAEATKYLPAGALDGFSSLTNLHIRTREAYTSALRDEHCQLLAQSRALKKLQSLSIEFCNISGKGLTSILRSPHLGPLSTLNLHVPARATLLAALADAPNVLKGLVHLSLAADRLSVPGVNKLLAVRDSLRQIRTLRIVAAETGGYDWELPFDRSDGAKNIQQLAKALCSLLPALEGLEKLEVGHRLGASPQVTTKDVFAALKTPKDIVAMALPRSMRA